MSRTSFKISVEKLINFSQDNGDTLGRDHLTSTAVDFEKYDIDFSTLYLVRFRMVVVYLLVASKVARYRAFSSAVSLGEIIPIPVSRVPSFSRFQFAFLHTCYL